MKNPPGLVEIHTGGSAATTHIAIDGVVPMVQRCTIIIDPKQGENQIKLHCFSKQKNKFYEDGPVQSFYGISAENYQFFKDLLTVISEIDDKLLEPPYIDDHPAHVVAILDVIRKARK